MIHQTYWDTMIERQRMYLRRVNSGQITAKDASYIGWDMPRVVAGIWTDDPILGNYRFCNVYRELDSVTLWIRDNIRIPYAEHPSLWFMLAIARTFNWPDTLAELIKEKAWPTSESFNPHHMTAVLDARKKRGLQIYTGAYMIRAESDRNKFWYSWTKQRYISEIVLGQLWADRLLINSELDKQITLEGMFGVIHKPKHTNKTYTGWGPFMTYEWVSDMRWTRYGEFAQDRMSWANAGPGAIRGAGRAFNAGQLPVHPLSQTAALDRMRQLLAASEEALRDHAFMPDLEMRDIEHWLCEYDKYMRVLNGEGRPRSLYKPYR